MESVETAFTAAAADASGLVTTAVPIIIGVAVLFVGIRYGKKLLAKL